MCGIAGALRFDRQERIDPSLLDAMVAAVRHRGPDDAGVWLGGNVGLGHRRLSVIDLSPRGRQPMENEGGSVRIVFNGEIYGFADLRRELETKGHRFRSDSDTEVVLHLWEEHGPELLARLRGMFAFAIWDSRSETLFLARDRLGKKPLHFRRDARGISFASEAKALLQDPTLQARIDPAALWDYLTFGYVPSPRTGLDGIEKLPPGHCLTVRDGRIELQRWWALSYEPKAARREADLLDELDHLLEEAVRIRLVSDVPLGALLSGGIDSSAVVAMMRRVGVSELRTFSIGFPERQWNELPHARVVARHFDTRHEELVVEPDAVSILPRLVWHYGEPYADSSALPSFWLCEMARRSVTVALGGDGGDESFGGYERYLATRLASACDGLPAAARSLVACAVLRAVPPGGSKTLANRLRRFVADLALPAQRRYAGWIVAFPDELKRRLCTRELGEAAGLRDSLEVLEAAYARSDARSFVEATMHADLQTYLPDDLLVKMDIASMAHGLEVRSPLLDHRLVELAARLPVRMKLRRLTTKWALKRVLRGVVPDQILDRPKSGFGVPLDRWFRQDLLPMTRDLLLDPRATARGWFHRREVERLIDEHAAGRDLHHPRLWALLVLEIWARQTLDQRCPLSAPVGL